MSNIIQTWKHIEELGDQLEESSRKLFAAARELASVIAAGRQDGSLDLPTEYARYSIHRGKLVAWSDDGYGYVAEDRAATLLFASDIDNGLLDHFPEVLLK